MIEAAGAAETQTDSPADDFIAAVRARDIVAMDAAATRLRADGARTIDIWQLVSDADRRSRPRIPSPLSKREEDILLGIAQGLSNDQIGRRLHISGSTVKTYLDRAFEKTGTRDRTRAVVQAMNMGWIQVPHAHEDLPAAAEDDQVSR